MKLRYASIIASLLFIVELVFFIMHRDGMSLADEPFSAFGNIDGNYAVFLFGTGALFLFLAMIIYEMYKLTQTKVRWEIYCFFVIGMATLLIHYNREVMLSRTLHTILGVMTSVILISMIIEFNKKYSPQKRSLKIFSNTIPWAMLGGTLLLFFILGLNAIMEIFYATLLVLWVNVINFNLEEEIVSKVQNMPKELNEK